MTRTKALQLATLVTLGKVTELTDEEIESLMKTHFGTEFVNFWEIAEHLVKLVTINKNGQIGFGKDDFFVGMYGAKQ
jgi:hypothetical protein